MNITPLVTARDAVDRTSYTTESISPAANQWLVVDVLGARAAGTAVPDISGLGLTWTQEATQVISSGARRVTRFYAWTGASPGSGVLTFDFAGLTHLGCGWSVFTIDGADVTDPFVQTVAVTGSGNSASAPLATFASSENRPLITTWHAANEDAVPETGYIEIGQTQGTAPVSSLSSAWHQTSPDSNPTYTWAASVNWIAIASEIRAAGAVVPPIEPADETREYGDLRFGDEVFGGAPLTVAFDHLPGLQHIFTSPGGSRTLPQQTGDPATWSFLGEFQDSTNMAGGFQSAAGKITLVELAARPSVYVEGATWLVRHIESGDYIFGGVLKEPVVSDGLVELTANGWGLDTEATAERVLFASQNMEAWAPGDGDPFNFQSSAKITSDVKGQRIVFEIERHTHFRRNASGNPDEWRSAPQIFWSPKVNLRRIKFDIDKRGPNMVDKDGNATYRLELVGTDVGPTGSLSVIQSWDVTDAGPDTVDYAIPDGYDLVGLRLVRTRPTKRAKHNRVILHDLTIGALATGDTYSLNQAYTTLFGMMGVTALNVAASSQNMLPYDASRVSLAKVADDFAALGQWFWRVWANTTGAKLGEAGPIGAKTYHVTLPQTPLKPLPTRRYNVVQYDYSYGGGYTSQETVRANPDPFPGADSVYVLSLSDPANQVLMEQFAQLIANALAQPWYAGSGTLVDVIDGSTTKSAHVVRPGDKLILDNNDGVAVIVDELNHSESGETVEVTFAESAKLVDQWIALREQRINQGLSPNAATLALLDPNEPRPPSGLDAEFSDTSRREGRHDFDMHVFCDQVLEDIDGEGTWVKKYLFRARPRDATTHAPIPRSKGGGWKQRTDHAPKDGEPEDQPEVKIEKVPHPNKWEWELQVKAIDGIDQRSEWSSSVVKPPQSYFPPDPYLHTMDVDRRSIDVYYQIPDDPENPSERHQNYHHAVVEVNDADTWTNPLRRDRKVKGEHKRFRIPKIDKDKTYWSRVTFYDADGNASAPSKASGTLGKPPTPAIGTAEWDARGTRHAKYRLKLPVSVSDAGHDDHIRRINVEMVHKETNVQPTAAEAKEARVDHVPVNRTHADPRAMFHNLPKNQYVFVRAFSVDTDQKESDYAPSNSTWLALGRPRDKDAHKKPDQPTHFHVNTPTNRRIVANWDDADDDDTIKWRISVFRTNASGNEVQVDAGGEGGGLDKKVRNSHYTYRVPDSDKGLEHRVECRAISDTGDESDPVTDSAFETGDPGTGTGELPPPPGQPSPPSVTFDAVGNRHAKYRAIVDPGTATGDVHVYRVALVHARDKGGTQPVDPDAYKAANPGASMKRDYRAVDGDATGDDAQVAFRNISKNHWVWAKNRARNPGGASAWSGWTRAGTPKNPTAGPSPTDKPDKVRDLNDVSDSVTVRNPAPRRFVAKWKEPDDDSAVRWEVTVKKGTQIVEGPEIVRNNRYTYRAPSPDWAAQINFEVYAISDTDTLSDKATGLITGDQQDAGGGLPDPATQPATTVPDVRFDAVGTRHAKYRAVVTPGTTGVTGAETYRLALAHMKPTGATQPNSPPAGQAKRSYGHVDASDVGSDDGSEVFRNIPKGHWVWAKQRARNAGGASGWSNWFVAGTPKNPTVGGSPSDTPNDITSPDGLNTVHVENPTPRRFVATWDEPDDDSTIRWQVTVKKGASVLEGPVMVRNNRYTYRASSTDATANITFEVRPVSDTGTLGTLATNSRTGDQLDSTALPSPPTMPATSTPTATFDAQGTRHAKYRAIVVPNATNVVGADHYRLALAHSSSLGGGTQPATPGTAKRRYSAVDASDTGDDFSAVFHGIPRNHWVWIKQRARNAGGPSNWSNWALLGTPRSPTGSATPNARTPLQPPGLTVDNTKPRRYVADWSRAEDDETVAYRVRVFRNGVLQSGLSKDVTNTRFVLRIDKADINQNWNITVAGLNETGQEGSVATGNSHTVPDEDAAQNDWDVGDIKEKGSHPVRPKWLLCNGGLYSTSGYPDLFAEIGYTWGGSGTAFQVPDLNGRHPAGISTTLSLGDDEGDLEGNRSTRHLHQDDDPDEQQHGHLIGSFTTGGSNDDVTKSPGTQAAASSTHRHDTGQQNTNSGAKHRHGHGHDEKKRPHAAVKYVIKALP